MALYVPLDVDFATDEKFLAAGPVAGYLCIASLALAKRTMSDGLIKRGQLAAIAIGIPKPEQHAQKLVEVGLWTETEDGWQITSWLKRNKSKAEIEAAREKKRLAGIKANHKRWHVEKDEWSDDCPFCEEDRRKADANRIGQPIASGVQVEEEAEEEPKAEAEPASDDADPRVELEVARRVGRRRSKGEDVGDGLVKLIRADVIRDFSTPPPPEPTRCLSCAGSFSVGGGWAHEPGCPERSAVPA